MKRRQKIKHVARRIEEIVRRLGQIRRTKIYLKTRPGFAGLSLDALRAERDALATELGEMIFRKWKLERKWED